MSELEGELDVTSMKVADLKRELKSRSLSTSGNKNELMERLQLAVMGTEENESDILGDEETDNLLKEDDEEVTPAATSNGNKKKVAINRDVAIPAPKEEEEEEETEKTEAEKPKEASEPVEAPSTDAATTDEEKAKARSERFNVKPSMTAEERKVARAARFGLNGSADVAPDMGKLKQRAERFGQVNSTTMKKAEDDEKIRKRQERFGVVTPDEPKAKRANITINDAVSDVLKKRAERFGLPASEDEKKKLRAARFDVTASS